MSDVDPVVTLETGTTTAPVVDPVAPVTPEPAVNEFRSWLLTQDPELQNESTIQNFQTFKDVTKSFIETKRMTGSMVKLPEADAPPEEVKKFFSRLGVPETADGYEYTVKEPPPATGLTKEKLDSFSQIFHKHNLTKAQADGIRTDYLKTIEEDNAKLVQEYKATVTQQMDVLKGRWGDKAEENISLAMRTFAAHANPTLKLTVEREGWGNHPDFVELFYKLGVATGEDTLRAGGTPAQAQDLDAQIKAVEAKLYALPHNSPDRKAVLEERSNLYKQRYPQPV